MDEKFPTRLVVPATDFGSGIGDTAYKGIKFIMDKNEINYKQKTIIQASDLKDKLEGLGIKNNEHTIVSMDIEVMYPSVSFRMVEKAVVFFLKDCPEEDKQLARRCLDMLKFGMGNTLITFEGKYWECGGDKDVYNKGLTIGGYESAWLADLVAAYVLENTQSFFEEAKFDGIYRDDGLVVFNGKKSTE